tara:strand:+ start:644 stop:934 length:291 start_codon:yes stop_codon:yes gene_type:complete
MNPSTYQSFKNINTPNYVKIDNKFTLTKDKTQCNPFKQSNHFGNYFQQCSKESQSAYWGSQKPVPDKCLTPQVGNPCNSIWNNLTRRKSVVFYDRK